MWHVIGNCTCMLFLLSREVLLNGSGDEFSKELPKVDIDKELVVSSSPGQVQVWTPFDAYLISCQILCCFIAMAYLVCFIMSQSSVNVCLTQATPHLNVWCVCFFQPRGWVGGKPIDKKPTVASTVSRTPGNGAAILGDLGFLLGLQLSSWEIFRISPALRAFFGGVFWFL